MLFPGVLLAVPAARAGSDAASSKPARAWKRSWTHA
jgi:hypothetical protein